MCCNTRTQTTTTIVGLALLVHHHHHHHHLLLLLYINTRQGTGIRGLMRGMSTLSQGNQELLVVRDKVGRPPGELGVPVIKSMEWDISPSVFWHCWLGDRKGIWPVKNWMLVCWWWWFDWSFAQLIAPVVQLSPPSPSSFASINTGYPRFTWKMAVKMERDLYRSWKVLLFKNDIIQTWKVLEQDLGAG